MRKPSQTAVCLVLLIAIGFAVFACTVELRRPWFDTLGSKLTVQFLTPSIVIVKNWLREGGLHLRFAGYMAPASVESGGLDWRAPYIAYPPGCLIFIYLYSYILNTEPTVATLMCYNLANQFLVACVLAALVFVFLRQMAWRAWRAFVCALIPLLSYLLLPSPMYQHQMRYVPDHIVILYFVTFVLLEILRDGASTPRTRKVISVLMGFVAFGGMFTDWFFAPVALCVYLKRIAQGQMGPGFPAFVRKSVIYWCGAAAALALFAVQLALIGGFRDILRKFNLWAQLTHTATHPWHVADYFWKIHMVHGYGKIGVVLVCIAFATTGIGLVWCAQCLVRRKECDGRIRGAASLSFLLTAPCLLHWALLRTHAAFPLHSFSALKFAVPISVVPFVLTPILVLSCLHAAWLNGNGGRRALGVVLPILMLASALAYLAAESPRRLAMFPKPAPDPLLAAAEFVGANTGYDDIVFTWDSDLSLTTSSAYLACSMKSVHVVASLQLAYDLVAALDLPYTVNLLTHGENARLGNNLDQLCDLAYEHRTANGLTLWKVRKADFLGACQQAHVSAPSAPPLEPAPPGPMDPELVRRLAEMDFDFEASEL